MSENVLKSGLTPRQKQLEKSLNIRFNRGKQGVTIHNNYGPAASGYCPLVNGVVHGFYAFYEAAKQNSRHGIVISAEDAHKYPFAEGLQ